METKEKNFEQDIETFLINEGGYIKGDQSIYDKKRAIDMPVLLQFIQATQPKVWQRYLNLYGDKSADQLYKVFQRPLRIGSRAAQRNQGQRCRHQVLLLQAGQQPQSGFG